MSLDYSSVILELESDNSRLFKEEVIYQHVNDPIFQEAMCLALDPLVTFGVSDKSVKPSDSDGSGLSWNDFLKVAHSLIDRTLTGNNAIDSIDSLINQATSDQWNNWYRRILLKDLKCGVSEKTVNNVAKKAKIKFRVPTFTCMLANDGAKHEKKMVGECIVEYKYDGVRVIAIHQDGKTVLHSRNGKVLSNFPKINKAIEDHMSGSDESVVIDGEVMSGDFQALMKQLNRKKDVQTDDAYLAVFDMITLEEFKAGKSDLNQLERKRQLDNFEAKGDCLQPVDWCIINLDTEEGQAEYAEMNRVALEKGYEGLMIKPIDGLYECKRSYNWLKAKPFIEVSLHVIDIEEGTGKYEGNTGALQCQGTDDGKFISVSVGSGLTDKARSDIWANKNSVTGCIVEIRADAITIGENSDHYSLRFPRFKTFRGFDKNEKL
jgi:DNA ligase-1